MTDESEGRLEMVSGRGAIRVRIQGVKINEAVQLLEDTARFVRGQEPHLVGADEDELEMMFKRTDLGDFVIVSIGR